MKMTAGDSHLYSDSYMDRRANQKSPRKKHTSKAKIGAGFIAKVGARNEYDYAHSTAHLCPATHHKFFQTTVNTIEIKNSRPTHSLKRERE